MSKHVFSAVSDVNIVECVISWTKTHGSVHPRTLLSFRTFLKEYSKVFSRNFNVLCGCGSRDLTPGEVHNYTEFAGFPAVAVACGLQQCSSFTAHRVCASQNFSFDCSCTGQTDTLGRGAVCVFVCDRIAMYVIVLICM